MQVNLLKYKESYGKIIILIGLFSWQCALYRFHNRQIYTAMDTMPKAVVMNDIIPKNPVNHVWYTKPVKAASAMKFLPVEKSGEVSLKQHTLWHIHTTHMIKREMRPKSIAETAGACKDPDSYGSVCSYYRGIYGGSGSPVWSSQNRSKLRNWCGFGAEEQMKPLKALEK